MSALASAGAACNPAVAELGRAPAWLCWRLARPDGKWTKVPVTPAGSQASSTDPSTWSSFAECWRGHYVLGRHDGLGRVLRPGEGLVA